MILSARGTSALAQDARAAGYSIVVPAGLRTDLAGAHDPRRDRRRRQPRPAVDRGGAGEVHRGDRASRPSIVPGEESATDRLAIYNQQLGAQSSDNDVYQIDVIWPGIMAQHATDLHPGAGRPGGAALPGDRREQHGRRRTWSACPGSPTPVCSTTAPTCSRSTASKRRRTTWAELEEQAQTIQDGERAANPDFWGFVWQGNAYEGLTCDALEWQVSNGGGRIIEPDGTVTINNPQAIAAFERARGWVGTISPEGVTTYKEPESRNVLAPGNAAFMRNWPYAYSVSQAADSPLVGKVGVAPAADGRRRGRHATPPRSAAGRLMVSKYSQNQEAAIEFVKFMCSPELQKAFAIERSHSPTDRRGLRRSRGDRAARVPGPAQAGLPGRRRRPAVDRQRRPLQLGLDRLLTPGSTRS